MIKIQFKYIFTLLLLFGINSSNSNACTTFSFETVHGPIVGKSFDWTDGAGYVMINKRGVEKSALLLARNIPAEWTSQYASLTFNQLGRELPMGGMNEAGLTVEIMWLNQTEYPDPSDPRPTLNESQWIQYQLDNFDSVAEMVAHAPNIKIMGTAAKVHYLACDSHGECASFEYLNGKLDIHQRPQLAAFTLTNDTAAESLIHLKQFQGFGGDLPLPDGKDSLSRFVRASMLAKQASAIGGVSDAFDILESVQQANNFSKWNIVYDVSKREVFFKSLLAPKVKKIRLNAFNKDCSDAVMVFDMNQPFLEGDVSQEFVEYSPEVNHALITHANNFLPKPLPEVALKRVIDYPETMRCVTP